MKPLPSFGIILTGIASIAQGVVTLIAMDPIVGSESPYMEISGITGICAGVGLLAQRNWGWILTMIYSLFGLLIGIFTLMVSFPLAISNSILHPTSNSDLLKLIIGIEVPLIAINTVMISYLYKPHVRAKFFPSWFAKKQDKKEFEQIKNIISKFQPQKIIIEKEDLSIQLFTYLKSIISDKIIERAIPTKNEEFFDLVIEGKYVFELKVYHNRTQIRDLGSKLEECRDEYPYMCIVILDNENSESSKANIKEYADKFKGKYYVSFIILSGQN